MEDGGPWSSDGDGSDSDPLGLGPVGFLGVGCNDNNNNKLWYLHHG